jgi:hypothetical protein
MVDEHSMKSRVVVVVVSVAQSQVVTAALTQVMEGDQVIELLESTMIADSGRRQKVMLIVQQIRSRLRSPHPLDVLGG